MARSDPRRTAGSVVPFLATVAVERVEDVEPLHYDEVQEVSVVGEEPLAGRRSAAARTQTFTNVVREQPDADPSVLVGTLLPRASYAARARTETMTKAGGERPDLDPGPTGENVTTGAGDIPDRWSYDETSDLLVVAGAVAAATPAARKLLR